VHGALGVVAATAGTFQPVIVWHSHQVVQVPGFLRELDDVSYSNKKHTASSKETETHGEVARWDGALVSV
jgi:hypothetical protein